MTTSKYADDQFKYGRTRDSYNENRIATALDNTVAHIVSMGSVMYPHVVQDWESSNGTGGNLSFEELFCTPSSQTALEFARAENAKALSFVNGILGRFCRPSAVGWLPSVSTGDKRPTTDSPEWLT